MSGSRRALFGLMLVALLARLAVWPWFAGVEPHIYDELDYVDIATNLALRGEFRLDGKISMTRPPLYPAMAGLVYRLAGVDRHQAVRLLQIFLDVAIVPLVFGLGRRLYDERTGLAAAGIAAFYPSLWGHDYLLLTEVLFTVLLLAGTLAAVESSTEPRRHPTPRRLPANPSEPASAESAMRPRWPLLVAAGTAFGLATLTRTSLLFYPPLFAIAVFGWWRAESRRRIAAVAVFVLAFGLTIAPWIARNTRLSGRLSSIDSLSTFTAAKFSPLRYLTGGHVTGRLKPRPALPRGEQAESSPDSTPESKPAALEADAALEASRAARSRLEPSGRRARHSSEPSDDPGSRIARSASGAVWHALLFWRIDRELAGAASRGWLGPLSRPVVMALSAVIAGYYMVLMVTGVLGLVLRPPRNRLQLAIVLSVIVVLAGVHSLSFGHSRYHIPLMPLAALFAARFWVARSEPVGRGRAVAAIAATLLLVGGWTATFVRYDLPDVRERLLGGTAGATVREQRR